MPSFRKSGESSPKEKGKKGSPRSAHAAKSSPLGSPGSQVVLSPIKGGGEDGMPIKPLGVGSLNLLKRGGADSPRVKGSPQRGGKAGHEKGTPRQGKGGTASPNERASSPVTSVEGVEEKRPRLLPEIIPEKPKSNVRDTIDSVDAGVYDDDDDDFGQGENYVFDEVAGEWTKKRRQLSARSRKREVIYREREQAMKRIENALVKSEELLLTDLDDEAEVGRAMRQQVLNLLEVQTEKMVGREEEMAELGQWFRIQADSAKSFISNPKEDEAAVDIDEFNVSIADNIIHRMTMLREKVTDISSSLMANALAMNNSEQWEMRLMGERRVFDEEMQRIITNLERVQRHSDDMGKTAMELREKLSKSQDEKNLWHRRFEELETKEQSLFAQMEETISHRTDVLNENMSRQATDSEQRIKELIKINETQRGESGQLKEMLRERETELIRMRADVALGLDKIQVLTDELKRIKNMAGPTVDTLGRMRTELENKTKRVAELAAELHLTRKVSLEENDELMRKHNELKKVGAERDDKYKEKQEQQATMVANAVAEVASLKAQTEKEIARAAEAEETAKRLRKANDELRELAAAAEAKASEAVELARTESVVVQNLAAEERRKTEELAGQVTLAQSSGGEQMLQCEARIKELESQLRSLQETVRERDTELEAQQSALARTESQMSQLADVKRQPLIVEKQVEVEKVVEKIVERQVEVFMDSEKERMYDELLVRVETLSRLMVHAAAAAQSQPTSSPHMRGLDDRIAGALETVDAAQAALDAAVELNKKAEEWEIERVQSADVKARLESESMRLTLKTRGMTTALVGEQIQGLLARVWRFRQTIVNGVFANAADLRGKTTPKIQATERMGERITSVESVQMGEEFVDAVLDGLVEFLTDSWKESGVHEVAQAVHEGLSRERELVTEAAEAQAHAEDVEMRLKTARNSTRGQSGHGWGRDPHFESFLLDMEQRDAEAKQRWLEKVRQIKEHRAQHILRCMDAFVKVVDINFKLQLRPGVLQDVKAMMYTSLVSRAERGGLESGGPRQVEFAIAHPDRDRDKGHARAGPIVHYDQGRVSPRAHGAVNVTGTRIGGGDAARGGPAPPEPAAQPSLGVEVGGEMDVVLTGTGLGGSSTAAGSVGGCKGRHQLGALQLQSSPPRGMKGHTTPKLWQPDSGGLGAVLRNSAATLAPRSYLAGDGEDEAHHHASYDARVLPPKPNVADRALGLAPPTPPPPKPAPPLDWGGLVSGRKNSPGERNRPMGPTARALKPVQNQTLVAAGVGARAVPVANLPDLPQVAFTPRTRG